MATSFTQSPRRFTQPPRRAVVILELIITLPILVLAVLAVVEMGLWMSGKEQIEMATRIGAEAAAETPGLGGLGSLAGTEIQTKIYRYLENAGISTTNVEISLEHNLNGGGILLYPNVNPCPPPTLPPVPPAQVPPVDRKYVRLILCIPSEDLTPNMLAYFGFDLTGRMTQHAKTYRYELWGTP